MITLLLIVGAVAILASLSPSRVVVVEHHHNHRATPNTPVALPPTQGTRASVRWRPAMVWELTTRQWRCPCGGVETDRHRASGYEHECDQETWS